MHLSQHGNTTHSLHFFRKKKHIGYISKHRKMTEHIKKELDGILIELEAEELRNRALPFSL